MPKYKVKIPFNFYKPGDAVTEKEYNKYGPAYFDVIPDNKMMDESNIITKDSVIISTPAAENPVTADGSAVSGDEGDQAQQVTGGDPVNLEDMDYKDLKELAASKGLEFKHNISKVDLIALIESKTE